MENYIVSKLKILFGKKKFTLSMWKLALGYNINLLTFNECQMSFYGSPNPLLGGCHVLGVKVEKIGWLKTRNAFMLYLQMPLKVVFYNFFNVINML
jgi:hypothetical protein